MRRRCLSGVLAGLAMFGHGAVQASEASAYLDGLRHTSVGLYEQAAYCRGIFDELGRIAAGDRSNALVVARARECAIQAETIAKDDPLQRGPDAARF